MLLRNFKVLLEKTKVNEIEARDGQFKIPDCAFDISIEMVYLL